MITKKQALTEDRKKPPDRDKDEEVDAHNRTQKSDRDSDRSPHIHRPIESRDKDAKDDKETHISTYKIKQRTS